MEEIWKDISDFNGLYQVSNLGRIRSLPREGTKGGIIKQFIDTNGYPKTHLYKSGKSCFVHTHRIVAQAFVPNLENKPQVNHKNGKKHDNRATNLEWTTSGENLEHALKNGLRHLKKVGQYKDGKLIAVYRCCHYAAKQTKIQYHTIYYCLCGIYKQAGGFEWKYM